MTPIGAEAGNGIGEQGVGEPILQVGSDGIDVGLTHGGHLIDAGIAPSIGTVGDALDNALMESTIGLYKTELIDHDRPCAWSGRAEVERETASWVHWYNTTRIHHSIGKLSPIEFEEQYRHTNVAQPGEVA